MSKTRMLRWTRNFQSLPALSVRQPWAWLIVNGFKDVENRSWATRHRGPLLVHAGLSKKLLNDDELFRIEKFYRVKVPKRNEYDLGGLIGVVDVLDCKERSRSRWHDPQSIGWVLANPRRLPFRSCKGALNFFKPKFDR